MQPAKKIESYATVHDVLNGTPWEKVGNKIPRNATVREALEAAELDWNVVKSPLFTEVETGKKKKKRLVIPKSYCLLRSTDNRVLSAYMGNRYKPVQNDYAFEVFSEFIKAGGMTMETAGSLSDGKHIWALASINQDIELAHGEVIRGYFLLIQSHLYGYALRAMFTPVRYPGGHTLVQPINVRSLTGTYRMPHSREFNEDRIQEIKELLGLAERNLLDFADKAKFLANSHLTEKDGVFYLTEVFNPEFISQCKTDKTPLPKTMQELQKNDNANRVVKKAAALIDKYPGADLPTCQGTAWGYFNAVLNAFDHEMGHNDDTRLESAWLGKNAGRKLDALNSAVAIATKAEAKKKK